jgi:hypothetical protein
MENEIARIATRIVSLFPEWFGHKFYAFDRNVAASDRS